MNNSSRLKLSIFATITLAFFGILAYIIEPMYLDKYAFYNVNTVIPILGYIVGRSYRSGQHTNGLINKGTRYKTAFYTFLGSLIIGFAAYLYSPEYIDNMGSYMMTVVMASTSYILGRSFKPSPDNKDNTKQINS